MTNIKLTQRLLVSLAATALLGLAAGCYSNSESKTKETTTTTGSNSREKMTTETPLPAGAVVEVTPPLPTTLSSTGTIFTVRVTSPNGIGISDIHCQVRLSPVKGNQISTTTATFARKDPNAKVSDLTDEGLVIYGKTRAGGVFHFKLTASHGGGRDRVELVVGDKHYSSEYDTVAAAQ